MHVALWITNISHQLASIISFNGFNINKWRPFSMPFWRHLGGLIFTEKIYHAFNLFSCLKSEVLSKNHSRKDLVYIQALEGI